MLGAGIVADNVAAVVFQELAEVTQQLEIIKQDIADLKVSCSLSLCCSTFDLCHCAVSRRGTSN